MIKRKEVVIMPTPPVTYSHIPVDYDLLAKRVAEELIKLEKNDECKKSNNDQDK